MMRAKMMVQSITSYGPTQESISMFAVTSSDKPYGSNGENEDNTYARFTPNGKIELTITNPNLIGKIKVGQKYYVDFTEAEA